MMCVMGMLESNTKSIDSTSVVLYEHIEFIRLLTDSSPRLT